MSLQFSTNSKPFSAATNTEDTLSIIGQLKTIKHAVTLSVVVAFFIKPKTAF